MIEVWLAWATVAIVAAAVGLALARRDTAVAWALLIGATIVVGATIVRVLVTGHLPKFGTFEESLGSVSVILVHTSVLARRRGRAFPAAMAAGVGGLLLAHGVMFPTGRSPLTISELSIWLDLHVFSAWLVAAAFAIAAGGALWIFNRGGESAESLLHRSLQVGFVFHSLLMLLGAWYSYQLFGVAFSFDPIEILAVIAWLVTASVLHLRVYRGLRGVRFAVLGLVTVLILFVSFRLILHLSPASTYHIIDLDLRLHT